MRGLGAEGDFVKAVSGRVLHFVVPVCLVLGSYAVALAAKEVGPGQALPSFTLKALNPEAAGSAYIKTSTYVGEGGSKNAALISFFATYCEPCKKEIPFLGALQRAYDETGLQILLVSIDTEAAEIEKAKALALEHGLSLTWQISNHVAIAAGYRLSHAHYPAGDQLHVLPYADVLFGL